MAAAAVALVLVMRSTLSEQVADAAERRAQELAAELEAGETPSLSVGDDEEQLIQVIDALGRVVAATDNVAGRAPVATLDENDSAEITVRLDGDQEQLLAAAAEASTAAGRTTVLVALTTEEVDDAVAVASGLLVQGAPVLLVLVAVTTWLVTGRALSPVEAARRQVDAISAADLHRRLPESGGRDEIARLVTTMNRLLGRLEDAQTRQRRFISDASHELRSPVATLRQHAEVAIARPEHSSTGELAETVLAESLRLQHLVEDLLLLARTDEHRLRLRRQPTDLDDAVFEEARRLRRDTDLHIDITGVSPARVDGDPAALDRALRNLGANAARHARSRIAFALDEQAGTVVLAVDDDGGGIAEADRRRVLERFVRLDEARTRDTGGAGLGLAIVAELVAAHGGSVAVGRAPLGGARFTICLPASTGGAGPSA